MGKIKQGILGGFTGKVGSVIGSSWKGIATMRAVPLSVANPRTAKQVSQRSKMTQCTAFARQILANAIKPLMDRFAQKQSGYNRFVSLNIANFLTPAPFNPALLIFSEGVLSCPSNATFDFGGAPADFTLTWDTTLQNEYDSNDDELYFVTYSADTGEAIAVAAVAERSDGTVTFEPSIYNPVPGIQKCHIAFRAKSGFRVSNSEAMLPT